MNKADKNIKEIERVEKLFKDFFDDYYTQNREIRTITYRRMENGDGFSAVIEWSGFKQYVNYYCSSYSSQTVNSCFLLNSKGYDFLCHFDDILDELDSDDLRFIHMLSVLMRRGLIMRLPCL